MPYRFLPDDFEERYRSVWVDVPHGLHDAEKTHGLYHEYLDELEYAEQVGFDGLCVNEHHNNADRKSTRLNSSHDQISYAVFCLKKKKEQSAPYCRPGLSCKSSCSMY